jgi:hypothetical protein
LPWDRNTTTNCRLDKNIKLLGPLLLCPSSFIMS